MALIIDHLGQFVADVQPAVARRIVRSQQGQPTQVNGTYAVRLSGGTVPAGLWRAGDETMNPNPQHPNPQHVSPLSGRGAILSNASWKDRFRDTDEVWVQNLSDLFISMDIEIGNGATQHVKIPRGRDPYRLTDEVTTPLLKNSNNFSKTLAKRSRGERVLVVLTTEEAEAFYASKAKAQGLVTANGTPDVAAAYDHARDRYRQATTVPTSEQGPGGFDVNGSFAPPKSAMELVSLEMSNRGYVGADPMARNGSANVGRAAIQMHEVVHPRVLHICQQLLPTLAPSEVLRADIVIEELDALGVLNEDSLQHIVSHGRYKSVKRWANQRLAALSAGSEVDDETPGATAGPRPSPVAPPQGAAPMGSQTYGNFITPPQAGVNAVTYQGPAGFANAPRAMSGAGLGGQSIDGDDPFAR